MTGLFTCFGAGTYAAALAKACHKLWQENPDNIRVICLASVAAKIEEVIEHFKPTYGRYQHLVVLDGCERKCASEVIRQSVLKYEKIVVITKTLGKEKKAGFPTASEEEEVYNAVKRELSEYLPKLEPSCPCSS